jgi:hypothetical protein
MIFNLVRQLPVIITKAYRGYLMYINVEGHAHG